MTEPVAYMLSDFVGNDFTSLELPKNPNNPRGLYFKEQLRPRVKMTKEQKKLMMSCKNNKESFFTLLARTRQRINKPFGLLSEEELVSAWLNPEETIEIVPDMKWFVRSKEKYQPDMDQGISESGYLYLTQGNIYSIEYYETTSFKDDAQQFDTEEEAEKWTNPLTEAVQLPVEDERCWETL